MLPPSHDPTCAFHSGSENLNLVSNYYIQDVYKLLYLVQETTLQNGNTARLLLLKVEVTEITRTSPHRRRINRIEGELNLLAG